uniref:hypothetical protein n=1 Tax=Prevotella sp. TaxID=59823 RepID=UPI003FF0805B
SRLSAGMGNGTIMEVITCGMATNHSLSYMVFVVSVLSYYVGGSNAPHPVHIYVIFDVIES